MGLARALAGPVRAVFDDLCARFETTAARRVMNRTVSRRPRGAHADVQAHESRHGHFSWVFPPIWRSSLGAAASSVATRDERRPTNPKVKGASHAFRIRVDYLRRGGCRGS